MFRMIKGNVERIVETEFQRNKFLSLGYLDVKDINKDVSAEEMTVEKNTGENTPVDEMTVEQLKALAKENNISGYGSMNKAALIESIKALGKE